MQQPYRVRVAVRRRPEENRQRWVYAREVWTFKRGGIVCCSSPTDSVFTLVIVGKGVFDAMALAHLSSSLTTSVWPRVAAQWMGCMPDVATDAVSGAPCSRLRVRVRVGVTVRVSGAPCSRGAGGVSGRGRELRGWSAQVPTVAQWGDCTPPPRVAVASVCPFPAHALSAAPAPIADFGVSPAPRASPRGRRCPSARPSARLIRKWGSPGGGWVKKRASEEVSLAKGGKTNGYAKMSRF